MKRAFAANGLAIFAASATRAICSVNRGFRQDSRYQRYIRELFEEIFADVPIQLPARI